MDALLIGHPLCGLPRRTLPGIGSTLVFNGVEHRVTDVGIVAAEDLEPEIAPGRRRLDPAADVTGTLTVEIAPNELPAIFQRRPL